MAIYIKMDKKSENINEVEYFFEVEKEQIGIVSFNKLTNDTNFLKYPEKSYLPNHALKRWVTERLMRIQIREDGIFPDKTDIAK